MVNRISEWMSDTMAGLFYIELVYLSWSDQRNIPT
jgi:hypothetical protein